MLHFCYTSSMTCEAVTVISLAVQVNAKGIPVSLRAKVLPCRVVKRNWDTWVKKGLVIRVGKTYVGDGQKIGTSGAH